MRRLLVLGAGTAGTMVANKLRPRLGRDDWTITVVEQATGHPYQPGYLFVPFGIYDPDELVRPVRHQLAPGVDLVHGEVDRVLPDESRVLLGDGTELGYDELVIATGTSPRPEETPGLLDSGWRETVHDFYTLEGAVALRDALRRFDGGRLVVHITDMPIKCPVAPLEFTFLAEAFFTELGMRDRVEITYVTPLDGAFTKPIASARLGSMLTDRKIALEPDFMVEHVEPEALVSYDERSIPFDLLVTVPLNMGADYVARSGMGTDLNYVPVDKHTFLSPRWSNVFAIGDAADLPTSKAGAVAHFSVEVFAENFLSHIAGRPLHAAFDGHANCFIESGYGRALLIDFNYDTEPMPGTYPLPGVGPLRLLAETEANHWGKMLFRWMYWNLLLPGRELPVPTLMSMAGKKVPEAGGGR